MRIAALLLTVAALLVAAPSALGCTLLSASAGPVDANVAGTVTVHVDPLGVNLGLEGLLGAVVCSLIGAEGIPAA
jgi:hypothetical protein